MNKMTTPDTATRFEKFHAGWTFAFMSVLSVWILLSSSLAAAVAISTQPQGTTIILGDRVTFSVVASGTETLTYQWRKNGLAISGATSSSFTINPVAFTDAANYTVDIADTTPGTLGSSVAELMVLVCVMHQKRQPEYWMERLGR